MTQNDSKEPGNTEFDPHCETGESADSKKARIRFFDAWAQDHMEAMRLVLRGGKLTKKDGWRNVVEHSMAVSVAAGTLSELLDLPSETRDALCAGLAAHDWDKRIEKKKLDVTDDGREKIAAWMQDLPPGASDAVQATKITAYEIRDIARKPELSFAEIARYADSICDGSSIVPWRQRIDNVRPRYPHLTDEYFQAEMDAAMLTEAKIAAYLASKGMEIEPENIPALVREMIEKKIEEAE